MFSGETIKYRSSLIFHSCAKGFQFVRRAFARLEMPFGSGLSTYFVPSVGVSEVFFERSLLKSALSPGLDPEKPRSVFNSAFCRAFQVSIEFATWATVWTVWFFHEPQLTTPSSLPRVPAHLTSCDLLWDLHWTCKSAAKNKALRGCGDCWTLSSPGCAQWNGTRAQPEQISWALWRKIHCANRTAVTWDPFSSWLWLIIPVKTHRKISNDGQR